MQVTHKVKSPLMIAKIDIYEGQLIISPARNSVDQKTTK